VLADPEETSRFNGFAAGDPLATREAVETAPVEFCLTTGLKTGVNEMRSRQIVLARRSLSQRNISSSVSAFFGAAPLASLSK
jgi:hypothetical protein